jgi:glucokinase
MKGQNITIGVDIGGSHITCAAIDLTEGKLLSHSERRAAVDHQAQAEAILDTWAAALNATIAQIEVDKLAGIAFAIPGPFDYREGISKMQHKFASLYGLKIAERLAPKLGTPHSPPMRFLNDATSFAVGEAWLGMGKGYNRVIAITLGTGFGSAFIDGGVPITRRADVPKEGCLWHLPYGSGIADEYFSTRWFVQTYEQISGQKLPDAKSIAQAAHDREPHALRVFDLFTGHLSAFLIPWFHQFRADRLVIGGNIARAYDLFGPAFEENIRNAGLEVSVALSTLGERAALIGCARLFEEPFWEKIQDHLPSI